MGKVAKLVTALIAVGVIGYFALPYLVCMEIPERQKMADCNTNTLAFTMTCDHSPPYAIVLGIEPAGPHTNTFGGTIIIKQGAQTVATIPIDSSDMTPCNWLPGLDAYILTWRRTNAGEPLSELLRRGQTYDVSVTFAERPPRDSTLWFSSMGRAKWW